MNPVLIYFDTEFTDLSPEAQLISIGLSAEGREFYAESADFTLKECSQFVLEAVIPHLSGNAFALSQISDDLREWLESFGQPVVLVCDSETWDWRWLQQLFVSNWPKCLAAKPLVVPEAEPRAGYRQHHALDDARVLRLAAGVQRC